MSRTRLRGDRSARDAHMETPCARAEHRGTKLLVMAAVVASPRLQNLGRNRGAEYETAASNMKKARSCVRGGRTSRMTASVRQREAWATFDTRETRSFRIEYVQSLIVTQVTPNVTTAGQTTHVNGKMPTEQGMVGNRWYLRHDAKVKFCMQRNALIQSNKV